MAKILILAPHTDDAELACGGTISRLLREGNEVYCAVFSKALRFSSGGNIPIIKDEDLEDVLDELGKAMAELGVKKENLFIYQFPTRYLYSERQDILDRMIEIKNKIDPDIVFTPSPTDFHQDHQVVSKESVRAFKNKTIYGYEYPWNSLTNSNNCFFILDKKDIDKKIRAIEKYKSQKDRSFMGKWFIENWARINGIITDSEFAEPFTVIKEIK